jgi:succinoglycan biosynthesis protein ExoO
MDRPRCLISVITPAYNSEGFIRRAVNSALMQENIALEVVIVDDSSDDGTLMILRELEARDRRIRAAALDANGGPAKARNTAIEMARGDWVAVLDADDAILPGRVRHMLNVAQATGADIVLDNFFFYKRETGDCYGPALVAGPDTHLLTLEQFVAGARPYATEADYGLLKPMMRRQFLNKHRIRYPVTSRHGEDFLLMVECFLAGGRVALTRVPGYLYTTRSSGQSRTRVDYNAQVRDTIALLERDGVKEDSRLRAVLKKRARALRRLAAEHGVKRCVYGRDAGGLARLVLSNRWATPELIRVVRDRFAA